MTAKNGPGRFVERSKDRLAFHVGQLRWELLHTWEALDGEDHSHAFMVMLMHVEKIQDAAEGLAVYADLFVARHSEPDAEEPTSEVRATEPEQAALAAGGRAAP